MTEQGLEPRSSDNNSGTISITPRCVPQLRSGKLNVSDGWELLRSNLNEVCMEVYLDYLWGFFFFLIIHKHRHNIQTHTQTLNWTLYMQTILSLVWSIVRVICWYWWKLQSKCVKVFKNWNCWKLMIQLLHSKK